MQSPKPCPSVDKYPRTTYECGNHVHISRYSYSTVDVIKLRDMVNSGVRGTKNNHPMIEVDCTYYLPYHNLVPSTGNLHHWFSRRLRRFGLVAGAPSGRCRHARAAWHTTLYRRQYSTVCCAGAAERGAGEADGAKEVA
jgi:hypothetical protein